MWQPIRQGAMRHFCYGGGFQAFVSLEVTDGSIAVLVMSETITKAAITFPTPTNMLLVTEILIAGGKILKLNRI
jgi:hypothetical protein